MSSKTYPNLQTETRLFQNHRFIIGVDEVGRGAIAGPTAVGLSLLDSSASNLGRWPVTLRDSKAMTALARERVFPDLEHYLTSYSVGYASNVEIDEHGIVQSLRLAFSRAFANWDQLLRSRIAAEGVIILLDGTSNWIGASSAGIEVATQVKADRDSVAVASAAVLAKVTRDALMSELALEYPRYGLEANKGYASASHVAALRQFGPSSIHRVSWLGKILG